MRKLGSDTNGQRVRVQLQGWGVVNKDVVEANFLNARIYQSPLRSDCEGRFEGPSDYYIAPLS